MGRIENLKEAFWERVLLIIKLSKKYRNIKFRMKDTAGVFYDVHEKGDLNTLRNRIDQAAEKGMGLEFYISHDDIPDYDIVADIRFEHSLIEAHIPYPPKKEGKKYRTQEEKEMDDSHVRAFCEDRYMIVFQMKNDDVSAFVAIPLLVCVDMYNWRQRKSGGKWKPSIVFTQDKDKNSPQITVGTFKWNKMTEKDRFTIAESKIRKNETFEEFVKRAITEKKEKKEKS